MSIHARVFSSRACCRDVTTAKRKASACNRSTDAAPATGASEAKWGDSKKASTLDSVSAGVPPHTSTKWYEWKDAGVSAA